MTTRAADRYRAGMSATPELIEDHEAEWFAAQAIVPGTEVHADPDVTWVVRPYGAWGNAGTRVRFDPANAARRLDALLARYTTNGVGMGLWVAPGATPANLGALLKARRILCRRHYPAMARELAGAATTRARIAGITMTEVEDVEEFRTVAYPSIGRLSTPRRRQSFAGLAAHLAARPRRVHAFVARLDGKPVG